VFYTPSLDAPFHDATAFNSNVDDQSLLNAAPTKIVVGGKTTRRMNDDRRLTRIWRTVKG